MFKQITVSLSPAEREALQQLATSDLRYPKEQIRFLIRQEAVRRGLLPADQREALPQRERTAA